MLCPLLFPDYERGRFYLNGWYTCTVPHYVTLHSNKLFLTSRNRLPEKLVSLYRPTVQYVTLHSNKLFLTSRSRLYLNGWYPCTNPHYVTLHSNKLFLTSRNRLSERLVSLYHPTLRHTSQ